MNNTIIEFSVEQSLAVIFNNLVIRKHNRQYYCRNGNITQEYRPNLQIYIYIMLLRRQKWQDLLMKCEITVHWTLLCMLSYLI